MFCGTKSYLHSLLPPESTDFIEDDEDDDRPDLDISDEDEWVVAKEEKDPEPDKKVCAPSKEDQVTIIDSEMKIESDDDDPLEVPISKQDTYQEKSKPVIHSKSSPKVPQTQQKVNSNQKR